MEERIYGMPFSRVYPMLVAKAERKGRTKQEVDSLIFWLLGYDEASLGSALESGVTCREFYGSAPALNPRSALITGKICGVQIETIADPVMQRIRYLDKLVDELAKGRPMEKILR